MKTIKGSEVRNTFASHLFVKMFLKSKFRSLFEARFIVFKEYIYENI